MVSPGRWSRTTGSLGLLVVLALVLGIWLVNGRDPGTGTSGGGDGSSVAIGDGLPVVDVDDLPPEAEDTLALIEAGPPYPYDADGETFRNDEGLLPDRERGYYEEFTVETPGAPDRGARRIVVGDAGELYWTGDHYASFARIAR